MTQLIYNITDDYVTERKMLCNNSDNSFLAFYPNDVFLTSFLNMIKTVVPMTRLSALDQRFPSQFMYCMVLLTHLWLRVFTLTLWQYLDRPLNLLIFEGLSNPPYVQGNMLHRDNFEEGPDSERLLIDQQPKMSAACVGVTGTSCLPMEWTLLQQITMNITVHHSAEPVESKNNSILRVQILSYHALVQEKILNRGPHSSDK